MKASISRPSTESGATIGGVGPARVCVPMLRLCPRVDGGLLSVARAVAASPLVKEVQSDEGHEECDHIVPLTSQDKRAHNDEDRYVNPEDDSSAVSHGCLLDRGPNSPALPQMLPIHYRPGQPASGIAGEGTRPWPAVLPGVCRMAHAGYNGPGTMNQHAGKELPCGMCRSGG